MTKLIINADDFGYSRGVNYGIRDAHINGVLTSTTMMANMPGFEHGIDLSNEMPNLGIGIHLTLTCGKPLLSDVKSLVDENGYFHKLDKHYKQEVSIDKEELYREWDAQIRKIIDASIEATHIDSHHHIHTVNDYHEVAIALAKKYNLPIRNCFDLDKKSNLNEVKYNELFLDPFYNDEIRNMSLSYESLEDYIISVLSENLDLALGYNTVELMCHPAYIDTCLMEGSSFNIERLRELDALVSKKTRELIESKNIKLSTFKEI